MDLGNGRNGVIRHGEAANLMEGEGKLSDDLD